MSSPIRGATTAIVAASFLACAAPSWAQPPAVNLSAVLRSAAAHDPSIAASDARLAAQEAMVRQASVKPPPSIDLELENFGGTGPYLLDRAEATFSVERTMERGGKPQARVARAQAELDVIRLRGLVQRLDFLKEAQLAYADVLVADAALLVAEAQLISAERAQEDIDRRVKSARDPLFAGSRAQAITAQAAIERDQAKIAAADARAALSALAGTASDISPPLESFFEAPTVARAVSLDGTPDLALLAAQRGAATMEVALEESRTRPDPTVRAGVRYLADSTDLALVVGGSIPFRVKGANQGAIERARAEQRAQEADIIAASTVRAREIARLSDRMNLLSRETERIRAEVIPHALRSVDQVMAGFRRGGFEYNDVYGAETALLQARMRRVEVLREYHRLAADRDRLTGAHSALIEQAKERR